MQMPAAHSGTARASVIFMKRGYLLAAVFGLTCGAAFALSSCKQPTPQTQTQSPAPPNSLNGTLAPASATPPVATETVNTQSGGLNDDLSNQPPVYADQAPPPLPDYSQPPSPGDNYYWTPGYWDYSNNAYYWVPGEWVTTPWVGALWTPPYWDFDNGRYRFHHGYWGSRVGFYGGVNYGFGYSGNGYDGGHWDNGRFFYNRAATNVGAAAHNTYNAAVPDKLRNNPATPQASYNGGRGGINARPSAADAALLHERRSPPLVSQLQHGPRSGHWSEDSRAEPAGAACHTPCPAC